METCETCRYWEYIDPKTVHPEADEGYGLCRRYAPKPQGPSDLDPEWPMTSGGYDWCGEYAPKPAKEE